MKTSLCSCGTYFLPSYEEGDFRVTASLICSRSTHSHTKCETQCWGDETKDLPQKYSYVAERIRPPRPAVPPAWRRRTEEWKDDERSRVIYPEDRQQWPGEEWLRHITQILTSGSGEGAISDKALCHALALIELSLGDVFPTEKRKYFTDQRSFRLEDILRNLLVDRNKAAERLVGELIRRSKS